jgi:hypothetical protein
VAEPGDALRRSQYTVLNGLSADASGAAALYRADTPGGAQSSVDALALRQLWVEVRSFEAVSLAVGRLDINLGTLGTYPEANWNYVKAARLSQRLVGTVDWTHGAHAFHSVSSVLAPEGSVLHLFAAEPTTGVFAIRRGYERQQGVLVGGAEVTMLRGIGLENTEFTGFFVGYVDSRDPERVAALFTDIRVYTLGASLLGIYPVGLGQADMLLWEPSSSVSTLTPSLATARARPTRLGLHWRVWVPAHDAAVHAVATNGHQRGLR